MSKQILRSGTSVGANAEEAVGGISRKEFTLKMQISYKEARETKYWLRLLKATGFIDHKLADSMIKDCEELIRILVSILKSSKGTIPVATLGILSFLHFLILSFK